MEKKKKGGKHVSCLLTLWCSYVSPRHLSVILFVVVKFLSTCELSIHSGWFGSVFTDENRPEPTSMNCLSNGSYWNQTN